MLAHLGSSVPAAEGGPGAPRGSDVIVTLRLMMVLLKASLLGKGQVSMVSVICNAM
jgi:hypothetical protein